MGAWNRAFRKLALSAFLPALFIFFLHTPSPAQEQRFPVKFVKPLLLANYSNGTAFTELGGMSGGDDNKPGTLYVAVEHDDGCVMGNAGYAVRLDYDVQNPGEFTYYWIKLGKEATGRSGVTETLDLTEYNYLSFWVRGLEEGGNIKVELHEDTDGSGVFTYGRDITAYVYMNAYIKGGIIGQDWRKVTIPLKAFAKISDRSKMLELVFVFENKMGNRKGVVYVDEILFGNRPDEVLFARDEDVKPVKAPDPNSFKVNGASGAQCPVFKGANQLEIRSDGIRDNHFLESVRFEYSTDKGATWRTIGADYNVNKRIFKIDWAPDTVRQLHTYQVRAVAADIRGNEKPTGALIECGVEPITDDEFLNLIEKKAFEFFRDHQDPKTGLFADTSGGGDASIAATGLGLAALCIGAERKWIDKDEARQKVLTTLDTFLPQPGAEESLAEGRYGFFYHFLNRHTARRAGKAEISTVDTAILVAGALAAGEYFGGDVQTRAEAIYMRVEWEKFLSKDAGPYLNTFSMGWSPERGFLGSYWDYYTDEVILISLLAIGSPTHPATSDAFYAWTRASGAYENGKSFIYSWHGALFSYQYANLWFDFRGMTDRKGVNWFENSTNATLANRQFCIDNADKFKGYGPNSWGITSMARPGGYVMHFGPPPTGNGEPQYDGTISPTGPAGSIVFTPYLSTSALKYMYVTYPNLWGQYGLKDSYNLDLNWYASTYYGIGVGMFLIPIENFRTGFVWKNFMKNTYIKEALVKAGFTNIKKR